jgi:threonine/homoserine/homoserine lactone efflux protein
MSVAFLVTALIIVATPGTGVIYTISTGLSRGARASVVAAVGCTVGIVPHLVAAATGTAALLRASGLAFETVKFLGVAYLLYMAWASWRDKTPLAVDEERSPHELGRLLSLSGIFMAMTFAVFTFYGVFAAAVRRHLIDRPRIVLRIRKLFAASFVALGVRLATTAR